MLASNNKVKSILKKVLSFESKFDDDALIQEVVEIINQELNLDFVGAFIFSEDMSVALLRAGSGERGKYMVARKHKIQLNRDSIFTFIAQNEVRIIDGWSGKVYGCSIPENFDLNTNSPIRLMSESAVMHSENVPAFVSAELPDPFWEIALPLRLKKQVVGLLWIQILEFSKFTIDDCSSLQWLADQLSAILFKNLE